MSSSVASRPLSSPIQSNTDFFAQRLDETDPIIAQAIKDELNRQQNEIELIASENIVSKSVLQAQGSILTNKYAEGYPGKRYYGGCDYMDIVESVAIERACKLFGCSFANVQPHSGAQANQAVMLALLKPGDVILGMDLDAGGHLTHGSPFSLSGKWFKAVNYGVRQEDGLIDTDQVTHYAHEHRPKMIIVGGSAYSRIIDFAWFRHLADEIGAYLMADVSHYAGLIVAGLYPNPLPYAHVVTTTTHKTLRGPRGGMILSNHPDLGKKFNAAVFPGLQGGPLMHVIAAKAVAFGQALCPSFTVYAQAVLDNARTLAQTLKNNSFSILSDGTDCHMCLVDLRSKGVTGKVVQNHLEYANITCNKNAIPFDTEKPTVTSGIRLGTPAVTTRGFRQTECQSVAEMITEIIDGLKTAPQDNDVIEKHVQEKVLALCNQFPIYASL